MALILFSFSWTFNDIILQTFWRQKVLMYYTGWANAMLNCVYDVTYWSKYLILNCYANSFIFHWNEARNVFFSQFNLCDFSIFPRKKQLFEFRIDVIFSIELFEQFVLTTFAGQIPTKPMSNASASSFQQVGEDFKSQFIWIIEYHFWLTSCCCCCCCFRLMKICSSLYNGLRVICLTSTKV